jgi:hypothetical protein
MAICWHRWQPLVSTSKPAEPHGLAPAVNAPAAAVGCTAHVECCGWWCANVHSPFCAPTPTHSKNLPDAAGGAATMGGRANTQAPLHAWEQWLCLTS